MNKTESIESLAKALCKTQLELENATKSSENPFFKSKYADLAEVLRCIKSVAMDNGLSFTQMPGYDPEHSVVTLETMLIHESGEFISSTCAAPIGGKKDAQAMGSVTTYLRRYSLSAVFGLAQEDDDGNSSPQADNYPMDQNAKDWITAINAGTNKINDIPDIEYRKFIQGKMK